MKNLICLANTWQRRWQGEPFTFTNEILQLFDKSKYRGWWMVFITFTILDETIKFVWQVHFKRGDEEDLSLSLSLIKALLCFDKSLFKVGGETFNINYNYDWNLFDKSILKVVVRRTSHFCSWTTRTPHSSTTPAIFSSLRGRRR